MSLPLAGTMQILPKASVFRSLASVVFLFLGRGKQILHWPLETDQRNNPTQVQLDKTVPILDFFTQHVAQAGLELTL